MRPRFVGTSVVAIVLLGGCGYGPDLGDVPMPRIISGPTYTVDMVVDSALNLPRQAPVKLDGETVGEVESIRAVDYHAVVKLRITKSTRVPADSHAEVRLSAPIGESFVALIPPRKPTGVGLLADGSTIDLEHTRAAPDTTDLLTSLSVAITGGSYADLKTVVTELTSALDGNTGQVKHLLGQLDVLVTDLNAHRDDLNTALDGLDRLSAQLKGDSGSLVTSTRQLTPAIQQLARQQDSAMNMLASLTKLGDASTHVIASMSHDLGKQLRDATTLLDTVIAAQDKLEPTLKGLHGFATHLDAATPGDYAKFDLTIMSTPTITGLPFVNLDGSNPIEVPELNTFSLPELPFIGKLPFADELAGLVNGVIAAGGCEMKRSTIAQVLLIVIVLLGVVYVGDSVTQSRVFSHNRTVVVELASAGGLHDRSSVTFRGNRIGIVSDVRLRGAGVEAVLKLDSDAKVPVDTMAVVANLSPIGEQYLDFRPRVDGPPYLADGAHVPQSDTQVPLRFDKLLTDAGAVSASINPADLRIITRELGIAFGSKEVDLATMGKQARRNLTLLQKLQPATLSLLRNSGTPLQTVADHSADVRTFAEQLDLLTAQVKTSDPKLRHLLTDANETVPEVNSLIRATSGDLHESVISSLVIASLVSDRLPGLTHWLHWVPYQMIDMYESTRGGSGRVLLVPNPSPVCTYDTKETSPLDTTRRPASTTAHCKTVDPIVQQRGSQYAPSPH